MTNAPNWFVFVDTILGTLGSGQHGHVNDLKTYRVMVKVVAGLMSKSGIDGTLKAAFVSNIRVRADNRMFDWEGPIVATRHQQTYARKMGWHQLGTFEALCGLPVALDTAETSLKGDELLEAFQQYFSIVSADFQHHFSDVSAKMTPNLAENLGFWVSNEMNRMEMNHESMTFASQADVHDLPEPTSDAHEAAAIPLKDSGVIGDEEIAAPRAPCVTVWVKPDKRETLQASGYLDADGAKYSIKFTSFDHALERIGQKDAHWYDYMAKNIAPTAVATERAGKGIAARATLSGLYDGITDSKAYKAPIMTSAAVLLEWDEEVPARAWLINGEELHRIDLKKEAANRYKGVLN